jgi:hypothetical protein
MIGRIPLIAVLVGSLAFAGQAAADHGSRSDALITGSPQFTLNSRTGASLRLPQTRSQ